MKKIKLILLQNFLKFFLNVLFLTCKWKIENENSFREFQKKEKPILLCFWHCNLLCVSRYFKKSKLDLYGISSNHFDSEILAGVLKSWNIKLIRGSSSRGWVGVIKEMIKIFKNKNSIITLTNDGPKGPPKVAKQGALSVAEKCNAQIVAISADIDKKWVLNTWDKTIMPRPFSTINIRFSGSFEGGLPIKSDAVTQFINKNEISENP